MSITELPNLQITTHNGLVETAMRLLIVLESQQGQGVTLGELRYLDYFSVFSTDIDGPSSVHALQAGRGAAYNVRQNGIKNALTFLEAAELIYIQNQRYHASFDGDQPPYNSTYLTNIRAAADWMFERRCYLGDKAFIDVLSARMTSLLRASISATPPEDQQERFSMLRHSYDCDLERMDGLVDACEMFKNLLSFDKKTAANDNEGLIPPLSYFDEIAKAARKEKASTAARLRGLLPLLA